MTFALYPTGLGLIIDFVKIHHATSAQYIPLEELVSVKGANAHSDGSPHTTNGSPQTGVFFISNIDRFYRYQSYSRLEI